MELQAEIIKNRKRLKLTQAELAKRIDVSEENQPVGTRGTAANN